MGRGFWRSGQRITAEYDSQWSNVSVNCQNQEKKELLSALGLPCLSGLILIKLINDMLIHDSFLFQSLFLLLYRTNITNLSRTQYSMAFSAALQVAFIPSRKANNALGVLH